MGSPHELRPDMSVTDLAYSILKTRGKATHFKELISEIMRVKAISQENPGRLIAQMHTEINLDSRFIHQGSGEWGLREWAKNAKVVKVRPEATAAPARGRRALAADDDEEDEFEYEPEEEEEEGRLEEEPEEAEESESDDYYREEE